MAKIIGLVEDDATMRSLLETLFRLEGFSPIPYLDTEFESIILQIIEQKPSALLIDVHLKNFNGIDLTNRIRNNSVIEQPLIVMASGMDHTAQCLEAGADFFLLKPYLPQQLIDWLNNHLP